MRVFVDTSALYAVIDKADVAHARAAVTWRALLPASQLVTHHFVRVEASQLVRRRLGPVATAVLVDQLLPSVEDVAVDDMAHAAAVEAWRGRGWTGSLVDQISFVIMRREGIDVAFAFDRDFEAAGFRLASAASSPGTGRLAERLAPYEVSLSGETDLVGVAEIAARSGHPTSTIQSWRRRHAGFPVPFAHLASGPVWRWQSVDRWISAEPRRIGRAVIEPTIPLFESGLPDLATHADDYLKGFGEP